MKLKNMFKKTGGKNYISLTEGRKPEVPEGLLRKCNNCKAAIIAEDVRREYISVQSVMRTFVWMHGEELRQS